MPRKSDWYYGAMQFLETNVKFMIVTAIASAVVFVLATWQGGETKNIFMLWSLVACALSCVACIGSGYLFDAINKRLPKVLREEKKEDEKNAKREKRTIKIHEN